MTVPAHRGASDVRGATCKAYLDRFAAKRAELPGAGLPWLDAWRERAIERFADMLLEANDAAVRCEMCAIAIMYDSECPYCKITYKDGEPLKAQPK